MVFIDDLSLSQCQGFIPASEWPVFLATLRESLPATFRITGTRSLANQILACLKKNFFEDLAKLEVDGVKVPPPFPLPWLGIELYKLLSNFSLLW